MILDVRTMYIATAATCFIVAGALFIFQARRFRQDGAREWAFGWALQGGFWLLLGLRGIAQDFLSIVIANTLYVASYSFPLCRCAKVPGTPLPQVCAPCAGCSHLRFFLVLFGIADNLLYRVIFDRSSPFCKSAELPGRCSATLRLRKDWPTG